MDESFMIFHPHPYPSLPLETLSIVSLLSSLSLSELEAAFCCSTGAIKF
jgi:hypothetical protein